VRFFLLLCLATGKLPEGPGKATVERVCGTCHDATAVIGMRLDRRGWKELVDEMVGEGAKAKPGELKQIVDYLAQHFTKN